MKFLNKLFRIHPGPRLSESRGTDNIPKNQNPPPPPAGSPRLMGAEFRDCEIRGRKTIELTFDNGHKEQFINNAGSDWFTYPMMADIQPKLSQKLNEIQRYLKTWGGPYPTAHKSQTAKGKAIVGEEGRETVVQPDGKIKIPLSPPAVLNISKGAEVLPNDEIVVECLCGAKIPVSKTSEKRIKEIAGGYNE